VIHRISFDGDAFTVCPFSGEEVGTRAGAVDQRLDPSQPMQPVESRE
jgi:hypothetical protein